MSPDPIVRQLREEREARNWSRRWVAQQLGCSTDRSVQQWEMASRSPTLNRLRAWADVLGFDLVLVPKEDR